MISVKQGDTDKLSILYERYKYALYGYFYRNTGKIQESEDLVQIVFMRMLQYKHQFNGNGMFKSWMYHIAHNAMIDEYRKRKKDKQNQELDSENYPDEINPETELELSENIRHLKKALSLLKDDEREIIILSRYQGLKYKEIGETYGCSEGTVKVRMYRSMQKLKNKFIQLSGFSHEKI